MELKYNDIVEFCKNNGTKKEVGVANIYELAIVPNFNENH